MASQPSADSESYAINLRMNARAVTTNNSGNLQICYSSNCRQLIGTVGSGYHQIDEHVDYLSIPSNFIHVPPEVLLSPEWHRFYLNSAIASRLNLSDPQLRVTVAENISSLVLQGYRPFMGYFMTAELCFVHEIFFDQTSYINYLTNSLNEMTSLSETNDDDDVDDEDLAPNGGGASRSAIERLIQKGSFEASKCDQDLDMCSVCLEEFSSSNGADHKLLRMDCSHVYHRACILPWLQKASTCPKCRRRVD